MIDQEPANDMPKRWPLFVVGITVSVCLGIGFGVAVNITGDHVATPSESSQLSELRARWGSSEGQSAPEPDTGLSGVALVAGFAWSSSVVWLPVIGAFRAGRGRRLDAAASLFAGVVVGFFVASFVLAGFVPGMEIKGGGIGL